VGHQLRFRAALVLRLPLFELVPLVRDLLLLDLLLLDLLLLDLLLLDLLRVLPRLLPRFV
jgi:hypothetical protein